MICEMCVDQDILCVIGQAQVLCRLYFVNSLVAKEIVMYGRKRLVGNYKMFTIGKIERQLSDG